MIASKKNRYAAASFRLTGVIALLGIIACGAQGGSEEGGETNDMKLADGVIRPASIEEASPPGCPKGYFCAWSGPDQTGNIVVRTQGNWSGGTYYQSYFNNGVHFPGADHVDITSDHEGLEDTWCVHYNPGPGEYKGTVGPGAFMLRVTWRGEC